MHTQAQPQGQQAGQRPADRRTLRGKQQRRNQIEESQPSTGQQRQPTHLPTAGVLGVLAQLPVAEQQSHAKHQRAQWRAVQQSQFTRTQADDKRQRRAKLQQQGKRPRQAALLTQAEPENTRAFNRPSSRGPARIQAQGNRQTAEYHTERQAGFH